MLKLHYLLSSCLMIVHIIYPFLLGQTFLVLRRQPVISLILQPIGVLDVKFLNELKLEQGLFDLIPPQTRVQL